MGITRHVMWFGFELLMLDALRQLKLNFEQSLKPRLMELYSMVLFGLVVCRSFAHSKLLT